MNDWLTTLLPGIWWLRFYAAVALIAGLGLLYILEQIIVYGNAHFCAVATALYRAALIVLLIGLFADVVQRLGRTEPPAPSVIFIITGLAILSVLIGITHNRHRDFGA